MGPPDRRQRVANVEVGGLFDLQSTSSRSGERSRCEIGDMNVHNYHGYFAYNFGASDASARPYFLGGAGATQYSGLRVTVGGSRELGGTRSSRAPGRSA